MRSIKIIDLNKEFKGNYVLKNINLELYYGKIYGFCGKNGSGKTMLFRAICGLIKPTSGQVIIDGEILGEKMSFPKSCGAIIEQPSFWENYSGFENLKILSKIKKIISDDLIRESMVKMGLDPNDKRKVKKYSLGMKQRLAITQAFMENQELIILDEPTNALDKESVERFINILQEKKKNGALILIATHNIDEIKHIIDYQYTISDGKIVEEQGNL